MWPLAVWDSGCCIRISWGEAMSETWPSWVTKQALCDVEGTFRELVAIMKRDVAEMNQLPTTQQRGVEFSLPRKGEGGKMVELQRAYLGQTTVLCSLLILDAKIVVRDTQQEDILTLKPDWSPRKSECRITIKAPPDNCEIGYTDLWRVSQRVLGPLFFTAE